MKKLFLICALAIGAPAFAQSADIASKTTKTETVEVLTQERLVAVLFTKEELLFTYARFTVLPDGTEHRIGSFQVVRSRATVKEQTVTHGGQSVSLTATTTIVVKFGEKFKAEDEAAASP